MYHHEETSSRAHVPPRRGRHAGAAVPRLDGAGANALAQSAAASEDAGLSRSSAPHGWAPTYWHDRDREQLAPTPGRNVGLGFIHAPLDAVAGQADDRRRSRRHVVDAASGNAAAATTARLAATFTGAPPEKTGIRHLGGVSIDQIIAQKYGQDTLLPSIQLGIEDPGANTGVCGWGYSCAYSNSISWAAPNKPLPHEINPQVVFERLYGDGGTPEAAAGPQARPATAFWTR